MRVLGKAHLQFLGLSSPTFMGPCVSLPPHTHNFERAGMANRDKESHLSQTRIICFESHSFTTFSVGNSTA